MSKDFHFSWVLLLTAMIMIAWKPLAWDDFDTIVTDTFRAPKFIVWQHRTDREVQQATGVAFQCWYTEMIHATVESYYIPTSLIEK